MEREELEELVDLIQSDAADIIHHQTVLAGVKNKLQDNQLHPFEQDVIYKDHFGQKPSDPCIRTIAGVEITTQVLHQTGSGLRDIVGADLLYEIEGEKYALIQYKKTMTGGHVPNDQPQLDTLLGNCPSVCTYKKGTHLFRPLRLNGFCGCWYNCLTRKGARYVHACEANLIFNGKGSASEAGFHSGLTKDEFDRMFAVCRIGALVSIKRSAHYIDHQLSQRHLVFHLVQRGRW